MCDEPSAFDTRQSTIHIYKHDARQSHIALNALTFAAGVANRDPLTKQFVIFAITNILDIDVKRTDQLIAIYRVCIVDLRKNKIFCQNFVVAVRAACTTHNALTSTVTLPRLNCDAVMRNEKNMR